MYHFGDLSTLYPISLPMQSTLGFVSKYDMMLSRGSFGHFLSNSQASWDEKHCNYFLTEKALSEIPKDNLHFERSGNRAL